MSDNMAFPIPNSVLEPYIKAAVATAITASLGDGVELVGKAVQHALATKVNSEGIVSNSSYSNTHQFVEVMATMNIQRIAREVIQEMAETMRPAIKTQIEKQIKAKGNVMANTLVDGLLESIKSSWNITVKIDPPRER